MTNHAVILMTALLPTQGHADLIKFATGFPDTHVWVLINGLAREPVAGELRATAVSEVFSANPMVTVRLSMNEEAPQNPGDHPHFWQWWRDEINQAFPEVEGHWTYVVASESYGAPVAESLGARFMPYDCGRELNSIKGQAARCSPWAHWPSLLPAVRRHFQLTAVLFGQESVGKTTVAKLVAEELQADWLFEYARPYLETVGIEITAEAMAAIHRGQCSLQAAMRENAKTPVAVLDTDLFSTVGYYPLFDLPVPDELVQDARWLAADVYYLLDDGIEFEPDPLRYGGHERTTSLAYWQKLLEDEKLTYVHVPPGTAAEECAFVSADLRRRFEERVSSLKAFVRG